MQKRLHGLITGVPSGDHLIIQGREVDDEPPSSKDFYLAFIETPRMATPQHEAEPYALAAREYTRKTLIGKRVSFIPEYKIDTRDFGPVWIEDEQSKTEIDMAASLLRQGLAKLKGSEKRNEARWDALKEIEDEAKDKEIGIWSEKEEERKQNTVRIIMPGMPGYNIESAFKAVAKEGKKTTGIVEYQFGPSAYNVLLVKYNMVVKISLDYIMNLPGGSKGTEQQQKLNKRARCFADRAVQHQEVTIVMERIDPESSVILGRIVQPNGCDLATELLSNGYAKLKVQNPDMDAKYYTSLRVALNQGQTEHKGFWKDMESKSEKGEKGKYKANVIEVNSGDSLTVIKEGANEELRLFLAGVKAPKMSFNRDSDKGEPFSWEAKEYLRKLLIGKQVIIEVEYTKIPKQEENSTTQKRPMTFVDVITPEGKCVNVEMAAAGLVIALSPRLDEQLGEFYQQIADAATKAKKEKKGINFVGENPPVHTYQSLIGQQNPKILAYYQDLFKKTPYVTGVVEYCFTGSRFKVRIDDMNCYIPFICQGLIPMPQDPNVPELQAIFLQGQKFAKQTLLQRDVKLDIKSSDRKGNFFGTLVVNGKNYVLSLIAEGLAAVNRPGSITTSNYDEAEEAAKKQKKGIWDPKINIIIDILFSDLNKFETLEGKDKLEVIRFVNDRYFYAVITDEGRMKKIEDAVAKSFNPAKADKILMPIRFGTYCMALFSEDGKWYRGQIERVISDIACEVLFLDYGNTEQVNIENIRKLDIKLIKDYPPLASRMGLAYLNLPSLSAVANERSLSKILADQIEGRLVTMLYKYKEGNVKYGIILEDDATDLMKSFNFYLLKLGLARVSTKAKLPEALREWLDVEEKAKLSQNGFWATNTFYEDADYDY